MDKYLLLCLFLVSSFSQFTSFVPGYEMDRPKPFSQSVSFFSIPQTPANVQQPTQQRNQQGSQQNIQQERPQNNGGAQKTVAPGSGNSGNNFINLGDFNQQIQNQGNTNNNNQFGNTPSRGQPALPLFLDQQLLFRPFFPTASLPCYHPRIIINGQCSCPAGQVFINGICNVVCAPPRIFNNGNCQCPNRQVFTSSGHCIELTGGGNTVTNCPNGIIVADQCFVPDDKIQFPVLPLEPISDPNSICGLALINRNYDGANNNLNNRLWGSKGSLLERRSFAAYADGTSEPIQTGPNARTISNTVGEVVGAIERSNNRLTMAFVIWGQFLDHDIDLTPHGQNEPFDIIIPPGDLFFGGQFKMEFRRSHFANSGAGPRNFQNVITAWIDGSQVYGSDQTIARSLRQFTGGYMKLENGLLPKESNNLFMAGDERVNENVFLTTYHTIFVREHNRLCDEIFHKDPSLNDEQVYQAARHYVIGLLQKITMQDFLPLLLGNEYQNILGPYTGYKPNLNPNIAIQFSTAAYRIGHALLVDEHPFLNHLGSQTDEFQLRDLFFRPDLISSSFMERGLRGLAKNLMKEKSIQLANSVRNLLVLDPNNRQVKLDLYSLNIQRGRDHGIPTYNEVRQYYGLPPLQFFQQLVSNGQVSQKLYNLYGTISKLDFIVGIFAENSVPGGVLGELGAKIVGESFRNLRDGDRFWYENPSFYPTDVRDQIKLTTFRDIIVRNSGINPTEVQSNMFVRN